MKFLTVKLRKLSVIAFILFHDVLFVKRRWSSINLRKAELALGGLILTTSSGLLLSLSLAVEAPFLVESILKALMLLGTGAFCVGSWGTYVTLAPDLEQARKVVRDRLKLPIDLSDDELVSAIIELIIFSAQEAAMQGRSEDAAILIDYAFYLWVQALKLKGLGWLTKLSSLTT
ncbi:MAG: hypothetical protein QXQ28_04010 [Candidatus Nezhaarchaeales archaeon]